MPKFMVRVVLHERDGESNIPAGDYTSLHDQLELIGLEKTIRGSDGTTRHLPSAEYRLDTTMRVGVADVRQAVKIAIIKARLRRRFSILVVRYSHAAWYDLDVVE